MIKIAVVEDEDADFKTLLSFLNRYSSEKEAAFEVRRYENGQEFLKETEVQFDVVFMDIELSSDLNGMEVSKSLREKNEDVALIFVTNLSQYALKGYEVEASGFMVKPIAYYSFCSLLERALRKAQRNQKGEIPIRTESGQDIIFIRDLLYIQISDHLLCFTTKSKKYEVFGKISDYEEKLRFFDFCRCSKSHLVNLNYVEQITDNRIRINGEYLPLSRRRKKSFQEALNLYLGGDR